MDYRRLMKFLSITIALLIVALFVFVLFFFSTFKTEILAFVETHGYTAILISSFIMDTVVQPFAPDVVLIGGIVSGLNVYLVLLAVIAASLIASIIGYTLGYIYGEVGIENIYGKTKYEKWKNKFAKYGKVTLLAAALTPVPYVPFCWVSGIFRMKKVNFAIYALLARTIRFMAGAYLTLLVLGRI